MAQPNFIDRSSAAGLARGQFRLMFRHMAASFDRWNLCAVPGGVEVATPTADQVVLVTDVHAKTEQQVLNSLSTYLDNNGTPAVWAN